MKPIVVENGIVTPADCVSEFVGIEVYEVLRLMNGVPLFWEEHFKRFRNSLMALSVDVPREPLFWADIKLLSIATGVKNCNVRFSVQIQNGVVNTRRVRFMEAIYPSPEMYTSGVTIGTLQAVRPEPTIKINNPNLREEANQLMKKNRWFEVLLVDQHEKITEGSRSNVFFIKGEKIYTPPIEQVLPGITRKRVMALMSELSIKCYERDVFVFQLEHMDALFLTGTSPKILPVKSCGKLTFDVKNPILQQLITAYNKHVESYLADRKFPD